MAWVRVWPLAAAALIGCASERELLVTDRPSDFVQVRIDKEENGLFDPRPAYETAHELCGQRLQTAVFFMGEDYGVNQRIMTFRCQ